jgi:hypothetical protein
MWALVLLGFVAVVIASVFGKRSSGRGRSGPGPAAAGAIYDLLNQDKRNAVEIIVEEKAGARDPEDADGNLPDLQDPRRRR